jgi:hypothetical protein
MRPARRRLRTRPTRAVRSGRLHLATVKAHEDRDLEALHKIKTSWKSYIRIALGSERERSKREYADCLLGDPGAFGEGRRSEGRP